METVLNLEQTRIFVKVVQTGGFSRAAELLKLPKSSVSKAVARLERESGTRLLLRTTRALAPTDAGRAYYERCTPALAALEDAQRALAGQDLSLSGHVRITAPEDLGAQVISPLIADLAKAHPSLSFELRYTDVVLDLVRDGYDVAIRIGKLPASRLFAKKLGETTLVAVAAPAYVQCAPRIRRPADLVAHPCLAISADGPRWTLRRGRETVRLEIRPRILCNQMTSLLSMAVRGAGVALVPAFLCRAEIQSGRLVRLLPRWTRSGVPVSITSPLGSSSSVRLRLVMDQLAAAVSRALAL